MVDMEFMHDLDLTMHCGGLHVATTSIAVAVATLRQPDEIRCHAE